MPCLASFHNRLRNSSCCADSNDSNEFLKDSDPAVDYQTRYAKSPASSGIRACPQTFMDACNKTWPGSS